MQASSVDHKMNDISLEDVYDAATALKSVLRPTELIGSPFFSGECGNNVFLKPENLQVTGAFKIRGAYNKISRLNETERQRGIIAASAGNHAQGVGYAARLLNTKARLVMPAATPIIKVEATRQYGVDVVLHGDNYDEAYCKARELEDVHGHVFVHPFDDPYVIAGQGTLAMEILRQLDNTDVIVVPVGGGGLIRHLAHQHRHIVQAGQPGGPKTALASNDFVLPWRASSTQRAHQDGLHDALRLDAFCQLVQRALVHAGAWLVLTRHQGAQGQGGRRGIAPGLRGSRAVERRGAEQGFKATA